MKNHLTVETLSNGLKVFLKEIHTAPISSWLWYRVGSRDEVQGRTGVSHWVEHMQFKGTPQFPASMLDKAISREGGMWNAMTYLDWTAYFETMPRTSCRFTISAVSKTLTILPWSTSSAKIFVW